MHDAQRLLQALGADQHVTLQTLYRGRPHRALYDVPIDAHLKRLELYNEAGSDVYFSVNGTSSIGRTHRHVQSLRALFVDYDHGLPTTWELIPSALVESSPGKFQAYWLLHDPGRGYPGALPMCMEFFTQWQDAENRWVAATGGDWAARDIARILRLPGFANHKYNPAKNVRLMYATMEARYTLSELRNCYKDAKLPATKDWEPRSDREQELPPDSVRERRFRTYLAKVSPPEIGKGLRNAFFYRKACAAVIDFALGPQLAAAVLTEWAQSHHGQSAYSYDEMLELANRAEAYGRGGLGSAYQAAVSADSVTEEGL
jgi:hypothetical protein